MDDHLVYTTPNHHPPKMDFLPKTFLQIILAAKWLARLPAIPYVLQTAAQTFTFFSD